MLPNPITILNTIKRIYPTINGGYSYRQTKDDMSDWDSPIDGLVWENTEFEKPTWAQISALLGSVSLAEIKAKKVQEIKAIRDGKNIEPITDTQAEIISEDSGEMVGSNSYFVFYSTRHPTNPAADPTSLLTNAIVLNQTVPYSSRDLAGNKVTVAITPNIARSLAAHLALRNNNNYKLADAIFSAINEAATEDAVNAITWSVDYL